MEANRPTDPIAAHDDIATKRLPANYAILVVVFATAACGGGGSPPAPPPPGSPPVVVLKPATDPEAARFILKASLAVNEAEITDIKSVGYGNMAQQANGYASCRNRARMDVGTRDLSSIAPNIGRFAASDLGFMQ